MANMFKTYHVLFVILVLHLEWITADVCQECVPGRLDWKTYGRCGFHGYAMRCNNTGLTTTPDRYPKVSSTFRPPLCLLDLSYNNITELQNQSFSKATNLNPSQLIVLYLNFNKLTFVAKDAFEELRNLMYLNLSGNMLDVKSFENGAFKPLHSLVIIDMKVNKFNTFEGLDKEFVHLQNLSVLLINPLSKNCVFGAGFRNLSLLEYLDLSGPIEGSCQINTVNSDMLVYVAQVKRLYMSNCNISDIHELALLPLKKSLMVLNISYNEQLEFEGMNNALYGLRGSRQLRVLNVNRIHTVYEYGIMLQLKDIQNLKTLRKLTVLQMDLNKIEVFDERIFKPKLEMPSSLLEITLAGNRLTSGKYIHRIFLATNLKFLDVSRQHLNYDPFYQRDNPTGKFEQRIAESICQSEPRIDTSAPLKCTSATEMEATLDPSFLCQLCGNQTRPGMLCIPPNLTKLKWQKSFLVSHIPGVIICGGKNLRHLDLSGNLLQQWIGPLVGLPNLKHLDLYENFCNNVSRTFFKSFPNLQHLNISRNPELGLSFDPHYNPEATSLFAYLGNVTKLDISSCGIEVLPKEIFRNMTSLEKLYVSKNRLKCWCVDLSNSKCLRFIDLSGNAIKTLPVFFTNYLNSLVDEHCNAVYNVTLDIGGNPNDCSCKSLPFYKWILKTAVSVRFTENEKCILNGERMQLMKRNELNQIVDMLEDDPGCQKRTWMTYLTATGSAVVGCIISSVAGILIYRNRWKLRYLYYSRNRRYLHEGYEHLFAMDAVISYAKGRASFIKNDLVPALEGIHGLSLWVADRNSQPGASIAENITHAIFNSRKTVLLVDKEYLKDSWCNFDMNTALVESVESKRQLIIVVLLEKQSFDTLPISVLRFLQTERSLEYPEFGHDIDTFWSNLATKIRS